MGFSPFDTLHSGKVHEMSKCAAQMKTEDASQGLPS